MTTWVVSNIFHFHPENWGRWNPFFLFIFFSTEWGQKQHLDEVRVFGQNKNLGNMSFFKLNTVPGEVVVLLMVVDPSRRNLGHGYGPSPVTPNQPFQAGYFSTGKLWRNHMTGISIDLGSFGG